MLIERRSAFSRWKSRSKATPRRPSTSEGAGAFLTVRKVGDQVSENAERQAGETVRNLRHSLINHLQVISGWLQLDRPDRAREHAEALGSRMAAESEAMRILPPSMALAVVELSLEAETHGVSLQWQVQTPCTLFSEERVADLNQRVRLTMNLAASRANQERQLIITLGPGEEVVLHTPKLAGEG